MYNEITYNAMGHENKCPYWSKSTLEIHTTLLFLSNCDLHDKKIILQGKRKFHGTLICLSYIDG